MTNSPRQAGAPRHQTLPRMPAAMVERRCIKQLHRRGRFLGDDDPSFLLLSEKATNDVASSSDHIKRPIARQGEMTGSARPRATINKMNRVGILPNHCPSDQEPRSQSHPTNRDKAKKPEQEARARMPRLEQGATTGATEGSGGMHPYQSQGVPRILRGYAGNRWICWIG